MTEHRDPHGGFPGGQPHRPAPPYERRDLSIRPPGLGYALPPPGLNPFVRLLRQNANVLCACLVLVFASSFLLTNLMRFLFTLSPALHSALQGLSPVGLGLFNMSFNTISLLVPALLAAYLLNMPYDVAFPLHRAPARLTLTGVFCCLGMSVVGVYLSAILTTILYGTMGVSATMPDFSPPLGTTEIIMHLIAISVVPAIFEELLFRGVVMQSLRRFGDPFALVVSSLLFAMLHRNLLQGPNAFVTGLVLGYFTLRSGSLIPAIIMHFVNNLLVGVILVVMMLMPAQQAQMLNFAVIPTYLALGVIGILLMISWGRGFTPMKQAATGLGEPRKYLLFFSTPLAIAFIIVTIFQTLNFLTFR